MKLGIFLVVVVAAFPVKAAPIFSWGFDQPTGLAGPFDVLSLAATLTNIGGSSETIYLYQESVDPGTFSFAYNFNFDTNSILTLNGIALAPNGTMSFNFGTLTPNPAPVPPDTYVLGFGSLWLCSDFGQTDCGVPQGASTVFHRTVIAEAVPEPASVSLIAAGLFSILWFRKQLLRTQTR